MNKLKKLLAATVLAFASVVGIFAQDDSNKSLALSKVIKWEESGKLVSTGGKAVSIENATYICDVSDSLLLVESSFEVPYYYTKFWNGNSGLICIGFGTSEESAYYVSQLEKDFKDRYIPNLFDSFSQNLEDVLETVQGYKELENLVLGGKNFRVYFVDLDSEFEEEIKTESNLQKSEESDVIPTSDLDERLQSILGLIVWLEESKVLVSSDCVGTIEMGYTYISDGKNRYVIASEWELPVCYLKIHGEDEDAPNSLVVFYGYDNDDDRLIFEMEALNLVDVADSNFFKSIDPWSVGVGEEQAATVEIDGEVFNVYFSYVNDSAGKEVVAGDDYLDAMENRQEQKPSEEELESLFRHVLSLEDSGKLVDTQIHGVNEENYAYISDGKNVYLVDDSYALPFEYNRIVSKTEGVPNILFVAYGHNDSWDRYYFSKERNSLAGFDGHPDFFNVDNGELYEHILGYTISYRNMVVLDGIEYEVYFSDINDDQEELDSDLMEEDVESYDQEKEIPALDKDGLENLLDSIVQDMNSRNYPSLLKTDKPYAILKDAGRYIMKTDGYATHVDVTGDYFFTAQLYTADYETGLMVVGFTRGTEVELWALSLFGEQQVDEKSIEEAHRKGEFFVTDYDLAEFQSYVDEAGYVLEKDVCVDGIKYHAYCIPITNGDWSE